MSIYSKAKDIYEDASKFRKDKDAARKIVDLLKGMSLLCVLMIFLLQYYNFLTYIPLENLPLLPSALRGFLDKYTFGLFVALLVYCCFASYLVGHLVIVIETNSNKKILHVVNTFEDVFEIAIMLVVTLKLINDLICFQHGIIIMNGINNKIYKLYLACTVVVFIRWIYIKNKNYWFYAKIKYTQYFDSRGTRIAKKDRVIYKGILYELSFFEGKDGATGEWWLVKSRIGKIKGEILLENAVNDPDGKITVHEFGMGEKGKI